MIGQMSASAGTLLVTVTTLEQVEVNVSASVTPHESGVVPTGKSEPDAGVQVVVNGAVPPLTVGANVKAIDLPSGEVADGAGQRIVGVLFPAVRPETSTDGGLIAPLAS